MKRYGAPQPLTPIRGIHSLPPFYLLTLLVTRYKIQVINPQRRDCFPEGVGGGRGSGGPWGNITSGLTIHLPQHLPRVAIPLSSASVLPFGGTNAPFFLNFLEIWQVSHYSFVCFFMFNSI